MFSFKIGRSGIELKLRVASLKPDFYMMLVQGPFGMDLLRADKQSKKFRTSISENLKPKKYKQVNGSDLKLILNYLKLLY